jgi:uncharacterized membrane protein YgcG
MRKAMLGSAIAFPAVALAQTGEPPVEQISLGASLVMLGFLLIAALIVVSFFCKLLVIFGLIPEKGRLRAAIIWVANAAGETRVTRSRDSGGTRSGKGGGGSFGGSGSSGNW